MSGNSTKSIIALVTLFIVGCQANLNLPTIEHATSLQDPKIQPFAAMYEVERTQYCLSNIDEDPLEIYIERDAEQDPNYDTLLRIKSNNMFRSIAFRQDGESYAWVGETESHYSGRTFNTIDGELKESIHITYYTFGGSGWEEGLNIVYLSDDGSGDWGGELTCEEAKRLIEEWSLDPPIPSP